MPKMIIQYQKTNETFFLQTETWNLTLCSVVHLVNGLQNLFGGFIGTKFYVCQGLQWSNMRKVIWWRRKGMLGFYGWWLEKFMLKWSQISEIFFCRSPDEREKVCQTYGKWKVMWWEIKRYIRMIIR